MKTIFIILGMFFAVNVFSQFTLIDTTTVTQQTEALTAAQRLAVLNGYAAANSPLSVAAGNGIYLPLVRTWYRILRELNDKADEFMRSETPPSTYNALWNAIDTWFDDDVLNPDYTDAILKKKIRCAHPDYESLSDLEVWNYYKDNI